MKLRTLLLPLLCVLACVGRADVVIVGVNSPSGGVAEPGWPILISAIVEPGDGPPPSLPSGLRAEILGGDGKALDLPIEAVALNPADPNRAYWMVLESNTTNLRAGMYTVTLQTADSSFSTWTMQPATLQVQVPDPENRLLQAAKSSIQLKILTLQGKNTEALAEASKLIAENPKNVDAWVCKGDILMDQDKPDEAMEAYMGAISNFDKSQGEPLTILVKYRNAFVRSLQKQGLIPAGGS